MGGLARGGNWWGKGGGGGGGVLRLSEVVYENCSAFAESEDGVFVERGVGGEDAFGETLDHGAGEGEVLVGKISLGFLSFSGGKS